MNLMKFTESQKKIIKDRIYYREHDFEGIPLKDGYDEYVLAGSWFMEIRYSMLNLRNSFFRANNGIRTEDKSIDDFMVKYALMMLRELCANYSELSLKYEKFWGRNVYKDRKSNVGGKFRKNKKDLP